MHATVIEFDSLADAVRAAAQNHDLPFAALAPLVLVAVGGIIIWRVSFEFGRTGIDQAVRRRHLCRDAPGSYRFLGSPAGNRQLAIGKSELLRAEEHRPMVCVSSGHVVC